MHQRENQQQRTPLTLTQQTAACLVVAGSLAALPAAADNHANAAAQTFHISGGTLSHALSQFAGSAGIVLSADARLTDGKTSHGLRGQFSVAEGLSRLLADSGLTYQYTANGSILVAQAPTPAPKPVEQLNQAEPTELPPVKVTGEAVYADDDDANKSAFDPYNTDYRKQNSSSATKTDTPIMATPMSIQVIPKQVLKDQQAIRIKDALKNVSGVGWATDPMYEGFHLRGFQTDGTTTVYRNGLRIRRAQHEVANLEQLEVVKGPAAAAYGRIEPGGLINVVTKKPLDTPYYSLEQQFGSYDLFRTSADATGPLNKDHSLLYRLNLAYQNNDLFIDKREQERIFFAPSISWKPSDRTEVNFNLEYQYDTLTNYTGIPVLGNRPANVPIDRYFGFGTDNEVSFYDKVIVGLDWSHQFNDDWKIQQRFHYYNLDYKFFNQSFFPGPANAVNHTATRSTTSTPIDDTDTVATNIDLTGKFTLFDTQHQVLAGFDYFWEQRDGGGFVSTPAPASHRPVVDIFNPVYGQVPLIAPNQYNSFNTLTQYWFGTYFQDQITLFDKLHIMGGGRYDWATRSSGAASKSMEVARANETEVQNDAFSPRVGVVYQPWPWLSLYGNYVESLGGANTALAANGKPLDAETAQQHEVGFKTELFDKKLLTTVAFYELTKQNIATADLINPRFSVQTGEARSRGIEVDISGQVTDGLSLIASYAYTDTEITKDNNKNILGHRLWNIPRNAGSFWAKYAMQDSLLRGLSFGTGVYVVGQREGNNLNNWQMPGYVRVDALLGYTWNVGRSKITTQFNINNLLDKTIYETSAFGGYLVQPSAPRTFMGSIKVEF